MMINDGMQEFYVHFHGTSVAHSAISHFHITENNTFIHIFQNQLRKGRNHQKLSIQLRLVDGLLVTHLVFFLLSNSQEGPLVSVMCNSKFSTVVFVILIFI